MRVSQSSQLSLQERATLLTGLLGHHRGIPGRTGLKTNIIVAALLGAAAIPSIFFAYLYCVEHGIVPVLTPVIGAAIGAGAAHYWRTHH